jgi:hypothetical protein
MGLEPRKLRIININDQQPGSGDTITDSLVDIVRVRDDQELQQLLVSARKGQPIPPDVFTIDIDLSESECYRNLENLNWGTGDGRLRPLGPLLALPFLASGECTAFRLYSSYWTDPGVKRNPFVLLALAVLSAAEDGKIHSIVDAQRRLDTSNSDQYAQLFEKAMQDGVYLFRQRLKSLIQRGRASVDYLEETIERLAALDEMTNASGSVRLPVSDVKGPLWLQVNWGGVRPERIELSSLFADLFLPVHGTDKERLRKMAVELRNLTSHFRSGMSEYQVAVDSLEDIERGKKRTGEYVLQIIRRKLQGKPELDEWLVRRLVVEFAWVKAWFEEPNPKQRLRSVRDSLGFETKDGKLDENASKKYTQLIAGKGEVVNQGWKKPFKPRYQYHGPNEAYQLDQDEPALLSAQEISFCRKYAIDELEWDGAPKRYPAWMNQIAAAAAR